MEEGQNNSTLNNKRTYNRRLRATTGWTVLISVAYYVSMFKGLDLTWFIEYAKWLTIGLGFLVGGLTITDVVFKR